MWFPLSQEEEANNTIAFTPIGHVQPAAATACVVSGWGAGVRKESEKRIPKEPLLLVP